MLTLLLEASCILFVIGWDAIGFFRNYRAMKARFIGSDFVKILDMYISRNKDMGYDWQATADDRRSLEKCKAYMQRARAEFLEIEFEEDQINLIRKQLETTEDHISSQVIQRFNEALASFILHSVTRPTTHSFIVLHSSASRSFLTHV